MRIERERGVGPIITGFSQGGFKVEANDFRGVYQALLIWPDGSDEWTPPALDALTAEAVAPLLAIDPRPEFLLLGTGATMQRPPARLGPRAGGARRRRRGDGQPRRRARLGRAAG